MELHALWTNYAINRVINSLHAWQVKFTAASISHVTKPTLLQLQIYTHFTRLKSEADETRLYYWPSGAFHNACDAKMITT